MKRVICASTKSYTYRNCRIYNTGNGFVVYKDGKQVSGEFLTSDEAEDFVSDSASVEVSNYSEDVTSACVEASTLTGRDFRKFLRSKEASRPLKSVAGDLLAQWYNREGASIKDVTYMDIGEMANAADDMLDRATVFYAMGYWNSDDFRDTLEGMGYDEDEIESIMR